MSKVNLIIWTAIWFWSGMMLTYILEYATK